MFPLWFQLNLIAMTIAITMITSSNLIYDLSNLLEPVLSILHFPKEVLSLSLLRPISGSSSLVLLGDILSRYGPDSFIGILLYKLRQKGEGLNLIEGVSAREGDIAHRV